MKRLIYNVLLLTLCTGCNMTLLPETQITEDDILENVIDVRKCFMDAYMSLKYGISPKIECDRGLADDMVPDFDQSDATRMFYEMDKQEMYRDETNIESLYSYFYSSIAVCNMTLEQLDRCTLVDAKDSVLRDQIRGEALALRAYDHFTLVNYYGRPYYDNPETNLGVVLKTRFSLAEESRTTVKVVYDTVLHDLNRARVLMTSTEDIPARFSADGATALLCRVYLFMNDWDMVIEEANKLIGKYELPADPAAQFENAANSGEIFTLDFTFDKYGYYYGGGLASGQFMDIFHEGDYRADFLEEDGYENWVYDEETGEWLPEWVDMGIKWKKLNYLSTYKVLRIAEVYLNRAEAYCEKGEYGPALADLKEVASRSGADISYMDGLTGQALLDEILQERRREFAGEGYRGADLLRKGLPIVRYYEEGDIQTEGPVQIVAPDHFSRILPIPYKECYMNKNAVQNPEYPRDLNLK